MVELPANTRVVTDSTGNKVGNIEEEEEDGDDDDDDEEEEAVEEKDEDEEVLVEVIEDNELDADDQSSSQRNEDLVAPSSLSEDNIDSKTSELVELGNHTPGSLPNRNIPPDARITKIDRRIVIPEALEEAKERFEERSDYVLVLRVLSQREVQRLADRTREIQEARIHKVKEDENEDRG
ncbi:hypothetical protein SLS56_007640 [Neofusicoccum ribis]|uniref:DUF8035 domain-containing protein n=1 Tax=Neofusicoccum ribis TaxID=45134 RepID=A0ABR3SMB7_9PEZI